MLNITINIQNKNKAILDTTTEINSVCETITNIETTEQVETTELTTIVTTQSYTDNELYLLSHLIFAEAGSDWISDETQLAVGSVALNRVKDDRFPNSLKAVIYQRGQYACIHDGNFRKTPNERAINNAKYLLEHGTTIPEDVVWQADFNQGKEVYKIIDGMIFCK